MQADFHIHSKYSYDSLLSPRLIIRMAKKRGLSAIAVTDHNTITGALETEREASSSQNPLVVPGVEMGTNIGDIIGLFVREKIVSQDFTGVVDDIKERGGLVILPHPFRHHKGITKQMLDSIDVIEVLNGRSSNIQNSRSREIAVFLRKPMIGGSDAHFAFEIGRVRTIMSDASDLDDLRKSIVSSEREIVAEEMCLPFLTHGLTFGLEVIKKIAELGNRE